VKPEPKQKKDILYNQARVLESKEFDLRESINRYLESALQDHQDSLKRLEKLAETEQHAQYALGCYYEAKDDNPQAAFYYAQATSGTHLLAKQALCRLAETQPAAQSHLAVLMQYGHGITENIAEAIRLHEGAAEKNIGLSQLHLGILYHLGFSSEENKKLALSLITKAEAQGIPQADHIKAQIQKENVENEKISKKAKSFDEALYYFSNKSTFSSLFSMAPRFDKAAFSRVRNKVQMESLEREKTELRERILELEGQVRDVSQVTKILLGKQIQDLREDLQKLEKRQIVVAEPAEEARQYFLNQKKQLFHAGFKEKISTVLEALDAVLAGDAKRNVSKEESTAMSAFKKGGAFAGKAAANAVPGLGIAVDIVAFAAEKYIAHKQSEKIKKQYTKVQGYYPKKGLEGVAKFAALLSAGLTYRFHEFLPHLKPESLDILWKHFILTFTEYLIEKAPDNASIHQLILGGTLHKCSFIKDLFSAKKLQTDYGIELSIDDILFSTGVSTPYGGKYLPTDPKRRAFIENIKSKGREHQKDYPIYRLGTKDEIDRLAELGIEMECIVPDRIGALEAHVDYSKAGGKFMLQANALVEQFMEDNA